MKVLKFDIGKAIIMAWIWYIYRYDILIFIIGIDIMSIEN